jgi:Cu/Ag efflux protein CusF
MSPLAPCLAALLVAGAISPALAQAPASDHGGHTATAAPATPAPTSAVGGAAVQPQDLSEGEITRWDPRTLKVTLRHGELKNLGMPPMTMVFRVKDASVLAPFQVGDKIRFRAERQAAGYFITHIEAAR